MDEKAKVLVVDDETVITSAARKILSSEGFSVITTPDAEKALEVLPAERPDVAFLDLMLPGISGMELLKRARRDFPDLVVVMMTGYSTLDNAVLFLRNGAYDYLPKPFEYEELLSTARRATRFRGVRTALPATPASPNRRFLGFSSWAEPAPDGTALLGVTGIFGRVTGRITGVELPVVNDEIRQGSLLAHVMGEDELRHSVWSALSGRVVQANRSLKQDPQALNSDPLDTGWLVRLIPDDLEHELGNLGSDCPDPLS